MGQQLGKYIKDCRRDKKISVKNLSIKTGISKSYLDYIESGMREPQVDILAKIAAALDLPLDKLLDIQKREQLATAMTKLSLDEYVPDEELRTVERSGNSSQSLDQDALRRTIAAYRATPDDKSLAKYIENPDLRAIVRAGATLSDEELGKLKKVMESLYPNAFNE